MTHITGNTDELAEENLLSDFYRSLGIRNFTAGGVFWYSIGLRLYTPVPCNRHISLSTHDLSSIWSQGALFIYFPSADNRLAFPGYIFVVEDKNYDLGSIKNAKDRYYIRRGLKCCKVESIPFELLLHKGSHLIEDTYGRQGRNCNNSVLEKWLNYLIAAGSNPLFEAWGAFVSNELAAFKVEFTFRGGVHAEAVFSSNDLLKYYPVNALLYVSTQQTMARAGISHVSYGQRPISGDRDGLVRFKESIGFKKVPMKQRLEVNPVVKPVFSSPLSSLLGAIAQRYRHRSDYARIVAGVISTLRGQIEHSDAGYGG